MIFERAKNGNGKLYGQDTNVCRASYIDRDSFIKGNADIWHSRFLSSCAVGEVKVRRSLIEQGSELLADAPIEISESYLTHTRVRGGMICGAYLENSVIEGTPDIRAGDSVIRIINSVIKDNAVVEGSATVSGITLEKRMRVGEGEWTQPPRYYEINNEIAEIGITGGLDGKAYIACNYRPMRDWIKKRKLWVKAVGWTEEMGLEVERIFTEWLDVKAVY